MARLQHRYIYLPQANKAKRLGGAAGSMSLNDMSQLDALGMGSRAPPPKAKAGVQRGGESYDSVRLGGPSQRRSTMG